MVVAVCCGGQIDILIHITNFRPNPTAGISLDPYPNEDSILIKPGLGSPVRVVKMEKDFVPGDQTQTLKVGQLPLNANKLPKPPTHITTGFHQTLFQSGTQGNRPVIATV
jgi:hypothetical protein